MADYTVQGFVTQPDFTPVPGITVKVFVKDNGDEKFGGWDVSDDRGQYIIKFTFYSPKMIIVRGYDPEENLVAASLKTDITSTDQSVHLTIGTISSPQPSETSPPLYQTDYTVWGFVIQPYTRVPGIEVKVFHIIIEENTSNIIYEKVVGTAVSDYKGMYIINFRGQDLIPPGEGFPGIIVRGYDPEGNLVAASSPITDITSAHKIVHLIIGNFLHPPEPDHQIPQQNEDILDKAIIDQEALNQRIKNLRDLNGIKAVFVEIPNPSMAYLHLQFYNENMLLEISQEPQNYLKYIFQISGGRYILGGPGTGQVQVTEAVYMPDFRDFLKLTVSPVGDYSTYTLTLYYLNIDPLLNQIRFRFRPGCFRTDCAPVWQKSERPKENPAIDYLAKDYDTFRHTLIAAMMQRVPGWEPTSEADLDMTLLELFSTVADKLSDYQDRVMNEAYLTTARKRVSLARHARLMDYHIHHGHQAGTILAVEINTGQPYNLPAGFTVWTGNEGSDAESQVFMTYKGYYLDPFMNRIGLYNWGGVVLGLKSGSTSADLNLSGSGEQEAAAVQNLIREGKINQLLIQEWLNPETGEEAGRDPEKRQILHLLPNEKGAEAMKDPVGDEWFVRVRWEERDQLKRDYCFRLHPSDGQIKSTSSFHGNLVQAHHGRSRFLIFRDPEARLEGPNESHYERTEHWGTICKLDSAGRMAYACIPQGNEISPKSTLYIPNTPDNIPNKVEVITGDNIAPYRWEEVISLIHSKESDRHFVVETDEMGRSAIRFGNGINGMALPADASVYCHFQVGEGTEGNVGQDHIKHFDKSMFPQILACWNPFDVTNGLDTEPVAEIIRRVQEAYQYRQLRAVTLGDYIKRAEELPGVSRAAARYVWTGSWRAVRIAVDPAGTTEFPENIRKEISHHLEAVRLISDDIEVRLARYVPLKIEVRLCIHPDYWPSDIRYLLEQEFSDGYTPDGRQGFFHPDLWTFGQPLYVSQIAGRIQKIQGVDFIRSIHIQRWNESTPGEKDKIEVQVNEIILVKNDPDHMEKGSISFDIQGGRR